MEFVILFFWLILMLFILRLAYLVLQSHQQTFRHYHVKNNFLNRHKTQSKRSFRITPPSGGRKINSRQWRELLRLVHGDVATANRLIDCELKRNPGRSLDWCIDKALWQLQRDRR
jgi:hypothetical protein